VYQRWTDAFVSSGGTGLLYWLLSGAQDDGSLYPDYDGFTVYCPSPVCQALTNVSTRLTTGRGYFPPVADNDAAGTPFNTAVTLTPTANDIAYAGTVKPASLDLDPATAGVQTSVTVTGGRFAVDGYGAVGFTPTDGYHGRAAASYTVADQRGTRSNAATLTVTVQPDPSAAIVLASFETPDLDGWGPASWQTDAGTVSRQSDFATLGQFGLHVAATGGGWFGATLAAPVDLAAKTALKVDLRTGSAAGTSVDIAVQVGPAWDWCQGAFGWVNQGTTTTFVADLTNGFSCDVSTLAEVHAIWVYLSPGTSVDLDNVTTD
jgi:mannan endo-1,4-beta-mannosidase